MDYTPPVTLLKSGLAGAAASVELTPPVTLEKSGLPLLIAGLVDADRRSAPGDTATASVKPAWTGRTRDYWRSLRLAGGGGMPGVAR